MSNVFVEEASLQDIANAIREKNGTENTYKPSEMGTAIRAIESGGGSGSNLFDYVYSIGFNNSVFPEGETDIVLELPVLKSTISFNNTNVTSVKIISNTGATITASGMFYICRKLTKIDFSEFNLVIKNLANFCANCSSLEEIVGVINLTKLDSANFAFKQCLLLKEIRFAQNSISNVPIDFSSSNLLSDESIQSIIDGLADLTGGTALTVTFHSDVVDKLTDEQITQITSKNWVVG